MGRFRRKADDLGMILLRRCVPPLALLAALAAFASPASASTLVFSDGVNLEIGGDDQDNALNVAPNPLVVGKLRVTAISKPLMLISGCAFVGGSNVADCAAAPKIVALLGGGSDVLSVDAFIPLIAAGQTGPDQITGGSADDTLEGNGGNDFVNGDGGNDSVSDGDRTDPATGAGGNDTLLGGAGDDYIDAGPLPGGGAGADTIDGQPGNDTVDYSRRTAPVTVTEGAGADDGEAGESDNVVNGETILGGSAGDSLTGAGEPNTLRGGRGDDVLDGGAGPDAIEGGAGTDVASYAPRVVPVIATLDGEPGDGASGENDAIASDVEGLTGGYESDTLTGSPGANSLDGRGGPDTLDGLGGDDSLAGGDGADTLAGRSGDDSLTGGDGADSIDPGTGADTVDAGPGDDVVHARDDARDTIACGDGADTVVADSNDTVAADCESVDRPAVASPPPPPDGGGSSGPAADHVGPVLRLPARVKLGHGKLARVRISCPAAEGSAGCRAVRLTVRGRGAKTLGSTRTKRIAGGTALTLKLRLRGVVPKRVTLRASAADAAGNRGSSHRKARVARTA
jgi:Ca2+-binding RTX toxin-like protein